jgi:hypothetical protein
MDKVINNNSNSSQVRVTHYSSSQVIRVTIIKDRLIQDPSQLSQREITVKSDNEAIVDKCEAEM